MRTFSSKRCLADAPFDGRTNAYNVPTSGMLRKIFSTSAFPTSPVTPVIKMFFPRRESMMLRCSDIVSKKESVHFQLVCEIQMNLHANTVCKASQHFFKYSTCQSSLNCEAATELSVMSLQSIVSLRNLQFWVARYFRVVLSSF